jgi:Fic/DOC family
VYGTVFPRSNPTLDLVASHGIVQRASPVGVVEHRVPTLAGFAVATVQISVAEKRETLSAIQEEFSSWREVLASPSGANTHREYSDLQLQTLSARVHAISASSVLREKDLLKLAALVLQSTTSIRRNNNWIGGPSPLLASYVPPPHDLIWRCLNELYVYWSANAKNWNASHALAASTFLNLIHPFSDGNGRIARALLVAGLTRCNMDIVQSLGVVQRFFGQNGQPYLSALTSWIDQVDSAALMERLRSAFDPGFSIRVFRNETE